MAMTAHDQQRGSPGLGDEPRTSWPAHNPAPHRSNVPSPQQSGGDDLVELTFGAQPLLGDGGTGSPVTAASQAGTATGRKQRTARNRPPVRPTYPSAHRNAVSLAGEPSTPTTTTCSLIGKLLTHKHRPPPFPAIRSS